MVGDALTALVEVLRLKGAGKRDRDSQIRGGSDRSRSDGGGSRNEGGGRSGSGGAGTYGGSPNTDAGVADRHDLVAHKHGPDAARLAGARSGCRAADVEQRDELCGAQ